MRNLSKAIRSLDNYCREFMRYDLPSWELKVGYSWMPGSPNFTKPSFYIKIMDMERVYYSNSISDPAKALSWAITQAITDHKKLEEK